MRFTHSYESTSLGTWNMFFFIHSFKTSDLIGIFRTKFIIVEDDPIRLRISGIVQDFTIAKLSEWAAQWT